MPQEPHPDILTPRLRLYRPCIADLDAHVEMEQDAQVMRFVHPPKPQDELRAECRRKIENGWPEKGAAFYVSWRDRPGFLGWVAVYPMEEKQDGLPELGYIYRQHAWGHGVATEAAKAMVDYAFRRLNCDPIVALTDPENGASQNVLAKVGFESRGRIQAYGGCGSYFVAQRADWLAKQP